MKRLYPTAFALFVLGLPALSAAQTAPAAQTVSPKAHADAQKLVSEGVKLWEAHSVDIAIAKWEDAFKLEASPNTLFFIARGKQVQGRFLEAVSSYRRFRDLGFNPTITERDRDEARLREMDCLKNLLQVRVRAPKEVALKVDGKPVSWSPEETVVLAPGSYTLELGLSPTPISKKIAGAGGDTVDVLDPTPATAGTTAPAGTKPVATATAGTAGATNSAANTAASTAPTPATSSSSSTKYIVGGGLAALGVAGIVGGVVFRGASNSSLDDSKAQSANNCGRGCPVHDDLYTKAQDQKTYSTISYIAGSALLAGGVAAIVLWPSSKGTSVAISPTLNGATVYGSF